MGKTKSKKPTLAQKKQISEAGLDPRDWRVLEDDGIGMVLVHRGTGACRRIKDDPQGAGTSRGSSIR